jgi:FkbM family methyltransferase
MNIKTAVRTLAERLTKSHIFRCLPRGVSLFNDIKAALPNYGIEVIFDVGANVGQSAQEYVSQHPSARIYCFEPIADTFEKLRQHTRSYPQVQCFHLALGSTNGTAKMLSQGSSTTNHLIDAAEPQSTDDGTSTESVDLSTLDDFCKAHDVSHISYLKIDTEGSDLEVLKGAENMLTRQCVDILEVEAGMTSHNQFHVPFPLIHKHLEQRNYHLFGVYEQINEWLRREPQLRRSNLVFISQQMIDRHRG